MIKTIAALILAFAIIVVGLTIYLGPDDLSSCGSKPSGTSPCQTADAIVAVSGGDTAARTAEAVRLYENGWAPKLIFSGAAQDKSGPSNAEAMSREAQNIGVSPNDIILEEYGATTKQNAENTDAIIQKNGIRNVILVTSAYHQRRAGLEFKARSGVNVRNHPVSHDDQWSAFWWTTPIGWFLAVSEFVKIIAFYLGTSR
jgi:uncharacterized SAM-binding protein YcdF (DUF218 family)